MDERVVQFRTGVMVLAALITTGILVVLFGELPSMLRNTYPVYIHFPQAPGVTEDTPIRKSGLLIGRVASVGFAEGGQGVLITARIDPGVRLYRNEICRLKLSLLGDADIEFVPSNDRTLPADLIKPGDVIVGLAPSDPLQLIGNLEGNITEAINSIARTSNEIGKLASQVNELLSGNQDQLSRIVDKVEVTFDNLNTAVTNANDVLGDPKLKEDIKQSLAELPEVLNKTRTAIDSLQNTVALADKNLKNVENFTKPLGDKGPSIVANIEQSTLKLDRLLTDFSSLTKRINSSEGSLNMFLNDPELYQNLNQAAENIACLTREMGPILNDARAFTDKIARHPERLGARGVFERSSGIK